MAFSGPDISVCVSNGIQQTVRPVAHNNNTQREKKVSGGKNERTVLEARARCAEREREREGGKPASEGQTRERAAVVGRRSRVSSMKDGAARREQTPHRGYFIAAATVVSEYKRLDLLVSVPVASY